MYSHEDRIRAVRLYIKLGKRTGATIRQLGYPTKNALKSWHREYEQGGNLRVGHVRSRSKYSAEQKRVAVEHYLNHDRFLAGTRKALGYPCRDTLAAWVHELLPETRRKVVGKAQAVLLPREAKQAAVIELCTRQVRAALGRQQLSLSEKVVRRLMKQECLVVAAAKRRRYGSYLGEISPAPENLINRDFHAAAPNEKWLTDITEFQIPAGKVYLSPMIDCFDGLIISWSIGTRPDAELVNTMLDAAIEKVGNSHDRPVVHSDRGAHYRWPGWLTRIRDAKLIRSMSRKGCSPDNAACEGFFGRLKTELFYPRDWQATTIEQFIQVIDTYIRWYNEKRIKIFLGSLSPLEYRESLGLTA